MFLDSVVIERNSAIGLVSENNHQMNKAVAFRSNIPME